jgi:hypothetical protein
MRIARVSGNAPISGNKQGRSCAFIALLLLLISSAAASPVEVVDLVSASAWTWSLDGGASSTAKAEPDYGNPAHLIHLVSKMQINLEALHHKFWECG